MGPPIQPFATNLPALDAFYMMFPALGSLLRWGSVFPMGSLLGAVPDTLLQPTAAASKVVLVLADDAAAKTRVPRQDSPPPPPNPFDWAANVGQMITNMQANPLLPPVPLDATLGAPLQNLLPLNPLTGLLGQAAPAPAVSADPPPPPAPVPDTPAPAPAPAPPAFPNFDPATLGQSITSMLSQAPPNLLSQMPPMPAIPQLQQFAQFLPQIPGLAQAPLGQASDISEVRVRPEIPYGTGTPQMKIKTALEKEQDRRRVQEMDQERDQDKDQDQGKVPLLWFRLPVGQGRDTQGKPIEDLQVEAKLKAFERQVITELKMLQQIERMAKEMRTSAATGTAAQSSDYRINYPLNHTPVHKITRADIEQALRDDYVRRLVQKEAQRRGFINRRTGGYKRQAFAEDKNLSKEEIVQIMAYAYRMANEQMAEAEKSKQDKIYAAYRSPAEGQWSEDQAKKLETQQQRQMLQQNPMMAPQQRQMADAAPQHEVQQHAMMQQQRQWTEEQAKIQQQRQWSERQANQQVVQHNQMIQQSPMMMQQRQWSEEQAKMQQERQWTEEQARQQAIQQEAMMMHQQRQWSEEQAKIQQSPAMMQQRQWTEEQAKQQAIPQQGPMMMQRQWTEEEAKALQDQQTMQQRQWDERQWADEKAKAQQQQALQMGQTPILQQMHQQPMMQQRMEQLLTHNPPTNLGQPEGDEDTEDATMLGEAGPQMAENEGTARHKGNLFGVFRSRNPNSELSPAVDPLGLGGNKRKKSKSRRPAVVNYYYPAPQPQPQYQVPQYQVPQYQAPSYGTSYGGGGYGSNAYGSGGYAANSYQRAAVGNDEVDDMLRRHQTLARVSVFQIIVSKRTTTPPH